MASANSAILTRLTSYGSPPAKVRPVAAAVRAVLLQLDPVGVVSPVLARDVIAVLALLAGQRDLGPNVCRSHDGVPFSRMDSSGGLADKDSGPPFIPGGTTPVPRSSAGCSGGRT